MILLAEIEVLSLMPERVGATGFEIALSKFADPDDIVSPLSPANEQLRAAMGHRGGAQNFRYAEGERPDRRKGAKTAGLSARQMMRKYHNHISARDARDRLGKDIFGGCHKIAIVQNPYDRVVSEYLRQTHNKAKRPKFPTWVRANPQVLNDNDQFYYINDRSVIDSYLRIESLEQDIATLEHQRPALAGLWQCYTGIDCDDGIKPLADPVEGYYRDDPLLVEAIRFFNADKIARFGYEPTL